MGITSKYIDHLPTAMTNNPPWDLSCLGSRTPGVKDTPFLGSVWGAKEAGKRFPSGELRLGLRSTY